MWGKRFERISRPFTRVSISAAEDRTELGSAIRITALRPQSSTRLKRIGRVEAIPQTFGAICCIYSKHSKIIKTGNCQSISAPADRSNQSHSDAADGKALRKLAPRRTRSGFGGSPSVT